LFKLFLYADKLIFNTESRIKVVLLMANFSN